MKLSIGYVAGYFDGEGCIGIYRNKGSKDSRYLSGHKTPCWIRSVSIVNTYLPVMEWCKKNFGGCIRRIVKDAHYKPCYQWTIGSKHNISNFLQFLLPCLIEKAPQARLMLRECRGKLDTFYVAKRLKQMKRRSHA